MSVDGIWSPKVEFLDPELSTYFSNKRHRSRSISVIMRPAIDRDELVRDLDSQDADNVERLATESVRADVQVQDLKDMLMDGRLEAVELIRPLRVFNSGN